MKIGVRTMRLRETAIRWRRRFVDVVVRDPHRQDKTPLKGVSYVYDSIDQATIGRKRLREALGR